MSPTPDSCVWEKIRLREENSPYASHKFLNIDYLASNCSENFVGIVFNSQLKLKA